MPKSLELFLTMLGTSLLLAIVAIPMELQLIKRNSFFGFRTPKTISSDAIWYPANRAAGKALRWAGIFASLGTVLVWGFRGEERDAPLAYAVAFLVPLAIALLWSFRQIDRIEREVRSMGGDAG